MRLRAAQLDSLGIEPEFLHLPRSVPGLDSVEYFLITAGNSTTEQYSDRWDFLAVGTIASKPSELELRQLRIFRELLEEPSDYNAWVDGMGLHSFSPAALVAFRELLLALTKRLPSSAAPVQQHDYFLPASAADYVACGIPKAVVDRFVARFRDAQVYRYDPDSTITPDGGCSFLRISEWTAATHPISSTMYVAFETYRTERIVEITAAWDSYQQHQQTNPSIDVRMMNGESTLRFSRGALLALANLLENRLQSIGPNSI